MAKQKVEESTNSGPLKVHCIVEPITYQPGVKHPLAKLMEEGGEQPLLKSIGFFNLNPVFRNNYVSYVMYTQGDKVLKIEVSEPNLKGIAVDESKINFVHHLLDADADEEQGPQLI